MQTFDFSFDLTNQYTFWSGTIAALFLFCSVLSAPIRARCSAISRPPVDEARGSLLMSAYWKIPLQALVLLVGVLMFVFYVFTPTPMLFDRVHERELRQGPRAQEYEALERRFEAATASDAAAAGVAQHAAGDSVAAGGGAQGVRGARRRGPGHSRRGTGAGAERDRRQAYNDVNDVFPTFIITHMPIGLLGLLIAAIFAAAMTTIVGGAVGALDRHGHRLLPPVLASRRRRQERPARVAHRHRVLGLFASAVAVWAAELGSLIEVVNRFGSFFYGSILGVLMLAIGWKGATANGAFIGLFAGMGSVAWAAAYTKVAFLWHNVIGAWPS